MKAPGDIARVMARGQQLSDPSIAPVEGLQPPRKINSKRHLIGDGGMMVLDNGLDPCVLIAIVVIESLQDDLLSGLGIL